MNRRICDYCGESGNYVLYQIKLTRRPNDTTTHAELCDTCLNDIQNYKQENGVRVA